MPDRDIQNIKAYGMLSAVTGGLLMIMTLVALIIVLATTDTGTIINQANLIKGAVTFCALLVLSAALSGIGGQLQRIGRLNAQGRNNLRLDWTALFVVLVTEFGLGLWVFQPIALIASPFIIGLIWIRSSVINLTSR